MPDRVVYTLSFVDGPFKGRTRDVDFKSTEWFEKHFVAGESNTPLVPGPNQPNPTPGGYGRYVWESVDENNIIICRYEKKV